MGVEGTLYSHPRTQKRNPRRPPLYLAQLSTDATAALQGAKADQPPENLLRKGSGASHGPFKRPSAVGLSSTVRGWGSLARGRRGHLRLCPPAAPKLVEVHQRQSLGDTGCDAEEETRRGGGGVR